MNQESVKKKTQNFVKFIPLLIPIFMREADVSNMIYKINILLRSYGAGSKNLPMFDTSASAKKTQTRRSLFFTKFRVFYTYSIIAWKFSIQKQLKGWGGSPLFLIHICYISSHVSIYLSAYSINCLRPTHVVYLQSKKKG